MRQAGVIAAAALYAIEHNIERLQEDHERAAALAVSLQDAPLIVVQMPSTNMVIALVESGKAEDIVRTIGEFGVACLALDVRTIRFVTHLSVSDEDVTEAAVRIRRALQAASDGLSRSARRVGSLSGGG
jgi:threonine aldolase